jgi:hypothetical protein
MLEAGAKAEVARVFETNDRVAADRILCSGGAMWHRAGRGRMEPEISAESMADGASSQCLLLSEAGTGDGRANSPDPRSSGRMEENVRQEACQLITSVPWPLLGISRQGQILYN